MARTVETTDTLVNILPWKQQAKVLQQDLAAIIKPELVSMPVCKTSRKPGLELGHILYK